MRPILYVVFTLSGAAGLIYEMIWSRYLALLLGHSAYAQVLVIAIFLGGMAVGALLAGARSERLRDPLKWYVGAELAICVAGLLFHEIFQAATGLAYDSVFPALAGGIFLTLFKWLLAAALILPQSILLGATFPLMAAGVMRRDAELPGRTLAFLYFTNSLGAAVGVLLAGFYFVSISGLPGTLIVAAMLNLAVALITIVVAGRYPADERLRVEAAGAKSEAAGAGVFGLERQQLVRLLLAVSFGTAVASFAYEIGWLRMLALVLGSATHSFELMLSAFILGLALGAFWMRGRADRWVNPLRALGIVQLAMGLTAMATLALYGASFYWMADLIRTFARTDGGYAGFNLARYGICLAIMFPASFCAGMTLPLITRTLLVGGAGERAIGAVYGINTLGSIVGVAIAGLILMPWIGLKGLIVGGATLDLALGAAILFVDAGRSRFARRLAYAAGAVTLVAAIAGTASRNFDERLLTSGVYRAGLIDEPERVNSIFYADGRTATVGVSRTTDTGILTISTNGKPDASLAAYWFDACGDTRRPIGGDASTQALSPLITLAHAPGARTVAVVGQGSGMSSHFLLGVPELERVVTIEIEPQMVQGSREFYPANRRVFDDPRSEIVIEDAKTYFASSSQKFDAIFSEPSNPWVSGIASLFTTEFYAHIKRYLAEGGVFGQWLQLYSMDDALVLSVLAAIHENFQSYEVFTTASTDMVIVAGDGPLPQPDWSVVESPGVRDDLCRSVRPTPQFLEATRVTHRSALAPLLDGWEGSNSDFYPVLDLLAERSRYRRTVASGFIAMPVQPFDLTAPFFGRRVPLGADPQPPFPEIPRVRALALGAALREADRVPTNTVAGASLLRAARYRKQLWDNLVGSGDPPADWLEWLASFREVDHDLHAGSAGYVAEEFYRPVFEYMDRNEAPAAVRAAVSFRHGLAGWDFAEAAAAARMLLEQGAHREGFVSSDELLDGGAIAMLRVGDNAGAIRLFDELIALSRRSPADLRVMLVRAYVDVFRAERTDG
jgi:predicted membrane-bound spermidine synthase